VGVLEGRELKRAFGSKREEVTGDWRELHSVELLDLWCSPNIIRVTTCRRMRWAGHVERTEERIKGQRALVGE
jgi:hypothetical protein